MLGLVWLPQYLSPDGVTVLGNVSKCQRCSVLPGIARFDVSVVARRGQDWMVCMYVDVDSRRSGKGGTLDMNPDLRLRSRPELSENVGCRHQSS